MVQHDLVHELDAGKGRDLPGKTLRALAGALDELCKAATAERAQRRIDGEAARATGELRHPVDLVAHRSSAVVLDQIGGAHRHRGAVRLRVLAEDERGVVRDVQPLVRVGDPGIRAFGAAHEVAQARARGRPQPEGAVDVQPRSVLSRGIGDLLEGVERPGVHLAGLRAHDRRRVDAFECGAQRVRIHAPLMVRRDRLRRTEPEQPHRAVDRHMTLLSYEDADARPACETVAADVPADALEDAVASSGKCSHAPHLGARDEPDRGIRRKAE